MPLKINNKYNIGQTVYICTDPEQLERLIIGIKITPLGHIYILGTLDGEIEVFEIEISETKRYDISG